MCSPCWELCFPHLQVDLGAGADVSEGRREQLALAGRRVVTDLTENGWIAAT